MGLHAVKKYIREKHGDIYHRVHLSLFAHQRVCIDVASFLFKYVVQKGPNDSFWVNGFLNFVATLRRCGVIPILVFDGKAPEAKAQEQQDRRDKRQKTFETSLKVEEALQAYGKNQATIEQKQHLGKLLQNLQKVKKTEEEAHIDVDNLLASSQDQLYTSFTSDELDLIYKQVARWKQQCCTLREPEFRYLQSLLTGLGVTWIVAPGESEAYCSWLVRHKYGVAVMSADTDCIAHRADIMIYDVDTKSEMCEFLNLQDLLDAWKLEPEQLIDFGILVGCDYNPNSRLNKIGPSKAIINLQKYHRIEDIPNLKDVPCLKHEMIRPLFNPVYELQEIDNIKCFTANFKQVQELIAQRPGVSVKICQALIELNNKKPQIVFQD